MQESVVSGDGGGAGGKPSITYVIFDSVDRPSDQVCLYAEIIVVK